MKALFSLAVSLVLFSCNEINSNQEKYQRDRGNVIDVSKHLVDLNIGAKVMLGGKTVLYTINDYLIVCDHQNPERGIHLFHKDTFEYITSTGLRGHGPGEIVRYGHIGIDDVNGVFYVTDFGKMTAFRFVLDSVLINPNYMPSKSFNLMKDLFPAVFDFVNDSVLIGKGLDVIDNQNFNSALVRYNILTESIEKIGEPNSSINVKNISTYFALSKKHNICVETFANYDLMTIRDLNGKTIWHVYGPQWGEKERSFDYFYITSILNGTIVAAFLGSPGVRLNEHKRQISVFPTRVLVFDKEGDYLSTLETGGEIFHFCTDDRSNRIIFSFYDKEHQFAFLDLSKLKL